VIYVSIVLNTCRSAGRASNRSTDRQIRVVPEQIADQQIVVPRSGHGKKACVVGGNLLFVVRVNFVGKKKMEKVVYKLVLKNITQLISPH